MKMSPQQFNDLLDKYLAQQMTAKELKAFLKQIANPEFQQILENTLENSIREKLLSGRSQPANIETQYHQLLDRQEGLRSNRLIPDKVINKINSRHNVKLLIAASFIAILLSATAIIFVSQKRSEKTKLTATVSQSSNPPIPGTNKAMLRISDGSIINLNNRLDTILPSQGNAFLYNFSGGRLSYQKQSGSANLTAIPNTLSTPKGGQYQLALSDGSEIWLNAASSLTFPSIFSGSQRNVELTGEAYFKIAPGLAPFHIHVNGLDITVLGTTFNVMAYSSENTLKITLLDGKIKISDNNKSQILTCGNQLEIKHTGWQKISQADTLRETAWKNGLFDFKRTPITQILRQVERWYNLQVIYEGAIPERNFTGKFSRQASLSQMLELLNGSDIKYRLKDHKLLIMP